MTAQQQIWFPVTLNLTGRVVLVIGEGEMALNKTRLLRGAGASVCVVGEDMSYLEGHVLGDAHVKLLSMPRIDRTTLAPHLGQCALIYIARGNKQKDRALYTSLKSLHIPICCVDLPYDGDFITPAIIRRGDVQISISTGGASPVLSRLLRHLIEGILPQGLAKLTQFLKSQRAKIARLLPNMAIRRRVWEAFITSRGAYYAGHGEDDKAQQTLTSLVENRQHVSQGEVWLVGAGPGNPDLLTLAALRLLQNADTIFYDNLVGKNILDYARRDAHCVYVGKQKDGFAFSQEKIHRLLVAHAQKGERVLRLKGGDPFVFGRGGEEMRAIMDANIPFRIVPAITAANGCASYAGIPLTHRHCAQQCLFITGHPRRDGTLDIVWPGVARRNQTIVIYMGLSRLAQLCEAFIEHGLPADWPAALVAHGTLKTQQVVIGTLTTLAGKVGRLDIKSPALIIIGKVVDYRITSP